MSIPTARLPPFVGPEPTPARQPAMFAKEKLALQPLPAEPFRYYK